MASSCSSKSTPVSDSPGHHLDSSSAGHTGKSVFQSCKAVTPGHTSSLGVPSMLQHSHSAGYVMGQASIRIYASLPEYLEELVDLGVSGEQRALGDHLR